MRHPLLLNLGRYVEGYSIMGTVYDPQKRNGVAGAILHTCFLKRGL